MQDISQRIIEQAGKLFLKYGIKSVTMDDISTELSISKKTIYQYFRDKDEIVSQVAENHLLQEKARMEEIRSEASNAIEQLYNYSACLREMFEGMNPAVLYDLRKYYNTAWQIYLDFKDKVFFHAIADILRQGIKEGYFRKDIDIEVLSILRLEEFQMTTYDSLFPMEKFDMKHVQMQLFMHFVFGIVTEEGYHKLNQYFKNNKIS